MLITSCAVQLFSCALWTSDSQQSRYRTAAAAKNGRSSQGTLRRRRQRRRRAAQTATPSCPRPGAVKPAKGGRGKRSARGLCLSCSQKATLHRLSRFQLRDADVESFCCCQEPGRRWGCVPGPHLHTRLHPLEQGSGSLPTNSPSTGGRF